MIPGFATISTTSLAAFLDTTVLGMPLSTFTLLHVLISLAGIGSGLVVAYGLLTGQRLDRWTAFFLTTTILTSATGYLFPVEHILPSHIVGAISLVVLAIALVARYARHMEGAWRSVYVITAVIALYFNVFVLVAQLFLKIPALHALAPTQKEPPFGIAQLLVLAIFIAIGIFAVKNFRSKATVTSVETWKSTKAS
jgi:hypothetical protein